jgi:hypothetical protein
MSNLRIGEYPGYSNILDRRYRYLYKINHDKLSQILASDEMEPETKNSHIRYVCVYNPTNPYLMFLIFILLIMSFSPPYQVIAYEMMD